MTKTKISISKNNISDLIRLYDFTKLYKFIECNFSEDLKSIELSEAKKEKYIILETDVTLEKIIQLAAVHEKVFLVYKDETFYIVKTLEKNLNNVIEYLGKEQGSFNKKLETFLIDGDKVVGMKNAIERLTIDDPKKSERHLISAMMDRPFDKKQLKLIKMATYNNTTYPVFTYGDSRKQIKGRKGLLGEFPSLTQKELNIIINKAKKEVPKTGRHIELIEKYGIKYRKGMFITTKKHKARFPNPTRLMTCLQELGESISRETLNKIVREVRKDDK